MRTLSLCLLALLTTACGSSSEADDDSKSGADSSDSSDSSDSGGRVFDPNPSTTIGPSDRPVEVVLPQPYDVSRSYPVVVMLHGYSATAALQDVIFGLKNRIDDLGFILIAPEGLVDRRGNQYWNAASECCDFDGTEVDDIGYISGLIEEAQSLYPVSHVAVMGHSNGGFMSYRMACERPDLVDRIAPLAGTLSTVASECPSTTPVRVLHMHGTRDGSVDYESHTNHNGARASITHFTELAGCTGPTVDGARDYIGDVDGAETTVEIWDCPDGDMQLWTGEGGDHVYLAVNDDYRDQLAAWMVAP
jgi:polyhydroxybutyrate depolymerase